MGYGVEEAQFLVSNRQEITAFDSVLELSKQSRIKDVEAAQAQFGPFGRAVMEYLSACRSVGDKLPEGMLYCSESAQQATHRLVSSVRAEYLYEHNSAARIYDVTCSVGTEGLAISPRMPYFGSDVDRPRLLLARENLQHFNTQGVVFQADALTPAIHKGAVDVIIADPARRNGSGRITRPDQLLPSLPALLDTWEGKEMAIKCAPGLDYSEWEGLAAVTSVNGAAKELCLYTPGLAAGGRRKAIMISTSNEQVRVDVIDDSSDDTIEVKGVGKYLIDPDPAVVRAGLVRHYGAREGLWMIDEQIAYLSGETIPAGRSGFEILEQVPLKKLKSALQAYRPKNLEILVRGVDVDPDTLRKKLRLRGEGSMAVVCTRIGRTGVALICKAREFALEA